MPLHSSHLLQPLNIDCFAPLKRAYYTKINSRLRYSVTQVKKETFLLAFRIAFNKAFTNKHILGSFRGARLVLYNLERVLLKLNVILYTQTPLLLQNTLQEYKTLATQKKILTYTILLRIYRCFLSACALVIIINAFKRLSKGAKIVLY